MPESSKQTTPIAETKRIVRHGRFLKDFQKEEDVNVIGLKGHKFETFYKDEVEPVLGYLKEEFAPWLEQQKGEFASYFEDIDWTQVEDAFSRGVKRSFVKQTRLYAKIDAEEDMLKINSDEKTQ